MYYHHSLLMLKITPYAKNAKKHPKTQVEQIARSIEEFGLNQPIVVDKQGVIIVGHGRYAAMQHLGMEVKDEHVKIVDLTEQQAKSYRLADNRLNESDWDLDLAIEELKELDPFYFDLTGFDASILEPTEDHTGNLLTKFGIPPFSIFDTRQGYWQDRKRGWLSLGIESEEGRSDNLMMNAQQIIKSVNGDSRTNINLAGTSVFDPVLCEIVYSWFNLKNGTVLDPFAGGSVRGIVASKLGQTYTGIELREEQVEANRKQAATIVPDNQPTWICGDSSVAMPTDQMYDLIFSCPPYADLEVYSDDPKDLSTMEYDEFVKVYRTIIKKAVDQLNDNRFAVFVVGEVRDKKGRYYNFVGDTIQAFLDAGMSYYNEIILVNAVGTLALRAGKQFQSGRKIGKCHQNVLVFYKGDPKKIKEFGNVELSTEV